MKLFIASISTETNTFSPFPTGQADFEIPSRIFRGQGRKYDELISSVGDFDGSVSDQTGVDLIVEQARKYGWESWLSLLTDANPAGPTVRSVYEAYRQEVLDDLHRVMPVDGVFLPLHGAMVAFGYDDCEGDLIQSIRNIAGDDCVIGVSLDPHCHLTEKMTTHADIIMCLKEYPHTDGLETMDRVLCLMAKTAHGQIQPVMSTFDCRMIDGFYTDKEPMTSFVGQMRAAEQLPVLAVSLAMGFPWADTADVGTKFLIITDGRKDIGDQLASQLGKRLYALRGQTFQVGITISEAIQRTLNGAPGTLVMADWSDVTGGGAPGDSTIFLNQVLKAGIENVALGMMYDPLAVGIATKAGKGAKLNMRIGGKLSAVSGLPLDLDVEVVNLADDVTQDYNDISENMGTLVYLKSGSVDLVLSTLRVQPRNTDCFDKLGIDLGNKRLIILKAMHHYRVFYSQIASEMLDVVGGGLLDPDFASLPYQKIKRPKWPLDENPFD